MRFEPMKRRSLAVLLLVLSAPPLEAAEQKVTFTVEKMTCAVCPITVRKAMEGVPGVISVVVDYDTKTALVVFEDTVTNRQAIAEASRMAGYPAGPAQ